MMKKQSTVALLVAMLLLCTACAGKSADTAASYAAEAPMAAMEYEEVAYDSGTHAALNASAAAGNRIDAPAETTGGQTGDADVRKIVYNADMSVTADDPAEALMTLTGRAAALGGYVSDSYERTDDLGTYRASATIKVPSIKLSELVTAAESVGKVNSYQLSSDDISRDYYDIQARLKSAQAEETQLLEILATCETVEDVLAVRASLASVRSDIESYQGQINLWDHLVSYATLSISIERTPRPAVEGEGRLLTVWKASDVFKKMSTGFTNSARFLVNAVGAVGIFLAYAILPAALIAGIVFGVVAIRRKTAPAREKRRARRREKRAEKAEKRLEKKQKNAKNE